MQQSFVGESASDDTARDDASGGRAQLPTLYFLFGSQSGNAELLAMDGSERAAERGFGAELRDMSGITVDDLAAMGHVVLVTSTYDEGELPDNARDLWAELEACATDLAALTYVVCAIGDSDYELFCEAGRMFDERLADLGARRLLARMEGDIDYEKTAMDWLDEVMDMIALGGETPVGASVVVSSPRSVITYEAGNSMWSRRQPYSARVSKVEMLTGPGSSKRVYHLQLDLAGSGIVYEPGDSLGVIPVNDPELVDDLLAYLELDGDTALEGSGASLRQLLRSEYELRTPNPHLVDSVVASSPEAARLLGDSEQRQAWLTGRDVLDVLKLAPGLRLHASALVELLRSMAHRTYSIASSPTTDGALVHLTISAVEYLIDERRYDGACSSYLSQRVGVGCVSVFPVPNPSFRLPKPDVPVIMIGPGTGIAPFRSFLRERARAGATGESWLFFGERNREHDYLYEAELAELLGRGTLTRLDVAFSRDQADKVYVQHMLEERGASVFEWLERGAHLYVCGDARAMAKDADAALHRVVRVHGGLDDTGADDYLSDMRSARRYQRDVY